MVSMVLRINHLDVVEADSVASALRMFAEGNFDAAIIDIFLDGASGVELITAIRETSPGFPVVAVSGMTPLDFVKQSPDLANVACLQKPFRPTDLLKALNTARTPPAGAAT